MLPFGRMLEYGNKKEVLSIKKVQVGGTSLAILTSTGKLYMRGTNNSGQFGIGVPGDATIRDWTLCLEDVDNFWTDTAMSIVRKTDGTLWCSGSLRFQNSNGSNTLWTPIPSAWLLNTGGKTGLDIKDIRFTFYDSLVLFNDGTLYGSGFNVSTAIPGGGGSRLGKITSNGVNTFSTIACGQTFTMALGTDGYWYRAGSNSNGQFGTGNTSNLSVFTMYSGLGTLTDCTGGYNTSHVTNSSSIWGCGEQTGNSAMTGVTSGNQLALKNVVMFGAGNTEYGSFKFFPVSVGRTYTFQTFFNTSVGIFSANTSGFYQVTNMSIDDKDLICVGGKNNIAFVYDGVLYGAGDNKIMNGGTSGNYLAPVPIPLPN